LAVIIRFEIPQKVPFGSSISAKDLAVAVNLPEDTLTRCVRYAIGNGIFCEPTAGFFAHSAASASLARSEHLRNIVLFGTHELSYVLVRLADALKLQQEQKEKAPQAAFNVAYPDFNNAFEYFSGNAISGQRYHHYLLGRVNTSRWSIHHLITAWNWASVGSGTIVDVCISLRKKNDQ
jgi:6-hydroxytryprostatin B O-methyltransferase